jgi:hypothetical protein
MEKLTEKVEVDIVRSRAEVYRELGARSIEITDDPRSPEKVLNDVLAKEADTGASFGQQVKDLLEISELSEVDVAERFGVSLTMIEHWKTGQGTPIRSFRYDILDFLSQRTESI